MSFFFCFYEHENDHKRMIGHEEYQENNKIDDVVEDEYGDVKLNLVIPSGIYNHLSCMADEEDMSVEDYIIQMATDGRIDDECRKEEYYEER